MSVRDFYDHQLQKHSFKLLRKYTGLSMDIECYIMYDYKTIWIHLQKNMYNSTIMLHLFYS